MTIPVFNFKENVCSLSVEQVFDIFQICQNAEIITNTILSKGLTECPILNSDNYLSSCDFMGENEDL